MSERGGQSAASMACTRAGARARPQANGRAKAEVNEMMRTCLHVLLPQDAAIRQVQTLVRRRLPALDLLALLVVHRRVYFRLARPRVARVPVGVVHERLREERGVDAAVDPPPHSVGDAEREPLHDRNEERRQHGSAAGSTGTGHLLNGYASGARRAEHREGRREEGGGEARQLTARIGKPSARRTSCTKKKSSPASGLLTAFGRFSILSLHEPISVSCGNGTLGLSVGSSGLPAQLAPMWNV